jgi:hypothetical protein
MNEIESGYLHPTKVIFRQMIGMLAVMMILFLTYITNTAYDRYQAGYEGWLAFLLCLAVLDLFYAGIIYQSFVRLYVKARIVLKKAQSNPNQSDERSIEKAISALHEYYVTWPIIGLWCNYKIQKDSDPPNTYVELDYHLHRTKRNKSLENAIESACEGNVPLTVINLRNLMKLSSSPRLWSKYLVDKIDENIDTVFHHLTEALEVKNKAIFVAIKKEGIWQEGLSEKSVGLDDETADEELSKSNQALASLNSVKESLEIDMKEVEKLSWRVVRENLIKVKIGLIDDYILSLQ